MIPSAVMISIDKDLLDTVQTERLADVIGIFDPCPLDEVLGVPVLGDDADWSAWSRQYPEALAILALDVPARRRAVSEIYELDRCLTIIAKGASVAATAKLGQACIVQRNVFVSADVVIGRAVKINVGAAIHHDSRLGDFVTVAPGARLLGSTTIEDEVYVGANATVLPNRSVGRGAVIGAGAVVTRDVPPGKTVVGVPARVRTKG